MVRHWCRLERRQHCQLSELQQTQHLRNVNWIYNRTGIPPVSRPTTEPPTERPTERPTNPSTEPPTDPTTEPQPKTERTTTTEDPNAFSCKYWTF